MFKNFQKDDAELTEEELWEYLEAKMEEMELKQIEVSEETGVIEIVEEEKVDEKPNGSESMPTLKTNEKKKKGQNEGQ